MNDLSVPILAFFVIGLAAIILVFTFTEPSIQPDEAFKMVTDTSNYSCTVSEVESELLLNCLKVK